MMHFLQLVVNHLYRFPRAKWRIYQRFGGYLNFRKISRAHNEMKQAVAQLPVCKSYTEGDKIFFLTGEKYLHQTLFCIASLVKVSDNSYHFILVDDGSLNKELENVVRTKVPGITIVNAASIEENLNKWLPVATFPLLRAKRLVYPHLKKLTDVHTWSNDGWKMVMDSDMLFWHEPVALTDWFRNTNKPVHMVDCEESYGYSRQLMEELCCTPVPEKLNVGIAGLNSAEINWAKLEQWLQQLESKEGKTYYLEQALTAMLIGNKPALVLPKEDYVVNPEAGEVDRCSGVLHHYVDLSKEGYFKKAWRKVL